MTKILLDVGGTHIRIARAEKDSFSDPVVIDTPQDYDDAIQAIAKNITEVASGDIDKVIIGLPGILNKEKSGLYNATNLGKWVGKNIKKDISEATGAGEVILENDTALVGLGEALYGAGKGQDIVAYITVSTGVGGVRIVRGGIDVAAYGFEPGHQIIDADGSLCPECHLVSHQGLGHLDNMISGKAMLEKTGKSPKDNKGEAIWNVYARHLAVGLHNTIVHWSPDAVVLGGSMIVGDPAIDVDQVERELREVLHLYPELPVIKKAELGDFGGLWGGLAL